MSSRPLVRCDGVGRTFGTGAAAVVAVHGATCEIDRGQQIALMGPSGSGKSTLLHLIAGLDRPTTGDVQWPAIGRFDELRPGAVGVIFQGPSLLPPLDVVENVALPLILGGESDRAATATALVALEALDLQSLASKLPEELSGGQAQRVAVARALAGKPRLILADEPTGQLDHVNGAAVVRALLDAASHGAALLVTTHDPDVARRFDRIWSMDDGELVTDHDGALSWSA